MTEGVRIRSLSSPCPLGRSIPSILTSLNFVHCEKCLFPVALRPIFLKAKKINDRGNCREREHFSQSL